MNIFKRNVDKYVANLMHVAQITEIHYLFSTLVNVYIYKWNNLRIYNFNYQPCRKC